MKSFSITDLRPYLYYMIINNETQVRDQVREEGPLYSRSENQIANAMFVFHKLEPLQTVEFKWNGPTYSDPDGMWKTYQVTNLVPHHDGMVLECMASGKRMMVDSVKDGWINLFAYDAFGQKTKFQMDLKYAGPMKYIWKGGKSS